MKLRLAFLVSLSLLSATVNTIEPQLQQQTTSIDRLLQLIGQAINNKTIDVIDNKKACNTISSLRLMLEPSLNTQTEESETICDINRMVLNTIELNLSDKFDTGMQHIVRSPQAAVSFGVQELTFDEKLADNETTIQFLYKNLRNLNLSKKQRVIKYIEDLDEAWQLTYVMKKVAPYAGLLTYYTFITNERALPQWQVLQKLKQIVGKLPKQIKVNTQQDTKQTISIPGKSVSNDNHQDGNGSSILPPNDYPQTVHVHVNAANIEKTSFEPGTGFLGSFFNKFGTLINFKRDHIFQLAPIALISPIIQKDAKALFKWSTKQAYKAYGFIKDEPYKLKSPIKPAKVNFDDIIGFEYAKAKLKQLIQYYKHKPALELITSMGQKGCIIAGPEDIGSSLAQALGGEISKICKQKSQKEACSIYTISAAELAQKKLSSIVQKAEKQSPCIILINNIDWLQADRFSKKDWASLLNTFTKTLTNRKHVHIIGTTANVHTVSMDLLNIPEFSTPIHITKPTFTDRHTYFSQELSKRFANVSNEVIEQLAYQTHGCSYKQLYNVIHTALIYAHERAEQLQKSHLFDAIDQQIFRIHPDYEQLYNVDKQMIAAYQAGKVIAHKTLDIPEHILKVTILPVSKNHIIQYGDMITIKQTTQHVYTEQNSIDACKVLLAGLIAQELLYGTVDQTQKEQSMQYILNKLINVAYQGVTAQELPKKLREEKLASVWQLIDTYKHDMTALLVQEKEQLNHLVNTLLEKSTLNASDL